MALNVIALMGRMVKDPEIRTTNSGKSVCQFTIAVDRGGDGTDFIDCTAWQKTADFVQQYFAKGSMIALNGRLQIDVYEKDGQKRSRANVVVNQVSFCGGKKETDGGNTAKIGVTVGAWQPAQDGFEEIEDNEDLPF